MVAPHTRSVGEPKPTDTVYCMPVSQVDNIGLSCGRDSADGIILKLEMDRAGVEEDLVAEALVRVRQARQGTISEGCGTVEVGEVDDLLREPCPKDVANRCGRLCVQNLIDEAQSET